MSAPERIGDQRTIGMWIVEKIIKDAIIEGKKYYYVKWQGWKSVSNTWQPLQNLTSIPQMIEEYHEEKERKEERKRIILAAKQSRKEKTLEKNRPKNTTFASKPSSQMKGKSLSTYYRSINAEQEQRAQIEAKINNFAGLKADDYDKLVRIRCRLQHRFVYGNANQPIRSSLVKQIKYIFKEEQEYRYTIVAADGKHYSIKHENAEKLCPALLINFLGSQLRRMRIFFSEEIKKLQQSQKRAKTAHVASLRQLNELIHAYEKDIQQKSQNQEQHSRVDYFKVRSRQQQPQRKMFLNEELSDREQIESEFSISEEIVLAESKGNQQGDDDQLLNLLKEKQQDQDDAIFEEDESVVNQSSSKLQNVESPKLKQKGKDQRKSSKKNSNPKRKTATKKKSSNKEASPRSISKSNSDNDNMNEERVSFDKFNIKPACSTRPRGRPAQSSSSRNLESSSSKSKGSPKKKVKRD